MLLAGGPLLAVTQPFLPSLTSVLGVVLWAGLVGVMGIAFWRSTNNLLGHVRAGAVAVIEALAGHAELSESAATESPGLAELQKLLGGLGSWSAETILATDPCVGKSLAQLNLRGLTGATVLAIRRGEEGLAAPGASDTLHVGDIVALAGSAESLNHARRLLHHAPARSSESAYEFFDISAE